MPATVCPGANEEDRKFGTGYGLDLSNQRLELACENMLHLKTDHSQADIVRHHIEASQGNITNDHHLDASEYIIVVQSLTGYQLAASFVIECQEFFRLCRAGLPVPSVGHRSGRPGKGAGLSCSKLRLRQQFVGKNANQHGIVVKTRKRLTDIVTIGCRFKVRKNIHRHDRVA